MPNPTRTVFAAAALAWFSIAGCGVDTSDVALAKEVLGPAVEVVEGERLVIRSADPARVNARLAMRGN